MTLITINLKTATTFALGCLLEVKVNPTDKDTIHFKHRTHNIQVGCKLKAFLQSIFHSTRKNFVSVKGEKQPIVLTMMNCNNDQHGKLSPKVQYRHSYPGSHQQLSNWT